MENKTNINWGEISVKLELVKELRKADLISPDSYKAELEKLARESGIRTKKSMQREYDSIYFGMAV